MAARILSILGPVYTGSTMLSGLLHGLPGVMSIGEIHHYYTGQFGCSLCGPSKKCPVLSLLSTKKLGDGKRLYEQLAEVGSELGFDIVTNSDKSIDTVMSHVPAGVADGIIMFKSPEAYIASFIRHGQATSEGRDILESIPKWFQYIRAWSRSHMRRVAYVEYEQLAGQPEETFTRLCAALDLPKPALPLVFPPEKPWHNVAGNTDAYYGVSHGPRSIYLDDRWKTELPRELQAHIATFEPVQRLLAELRRLAV